MATFQRTNGVTWNRTGTFKSTGMGGFNYEVISDWEKQNKSALDIINDYATKINNGEWMSTEDRAKYKSAIDTYSATGTKLRNTSKKMGQTYTKEDEKNWTDTLSSLANSYNSAKNLYSGFTDENEYSNWWKYTTGKNKYTSVKDAEDYLQNSQYVKGTEDNRYNYINQGKGAAIPLPGFTYGNEKGNLSVFPDAFKSWSSGDLELTDEEIGVYNYYYATQGKEKADEFLNYIADEVKQRKEGIYAQHTYDLVNLTDAIIASKQGTEKSNLAKNIYGFGAGVDTGLSGFYNAGALIAGTEGYTPHSQAVSSMIRKQLAGENGELTWDQLWYDLLNTTGNMAPSMAMGGLWGGTVGAIGMGLSAGGNSYTEFLKEGHDVNAARAYGILTGLSEAGLSLAFGGISQLGGGGDGIFQTVASKVMPRLNNGLARVALELGGKIADEALEEAAQSVLEPLFKHMATMGEEEIGKIDWGEVGYSALLGALSAGVLEGPTSIAGTAIQSHNAYTGAGGSTLGGVINAAVNPDINFAEYVTQGAQNVTNTAGNLATKVLAVDPENRAAKYVQKQIENGKSVSGYQINRLTSEIESYNRDTIKSAIEGRLNELGEKGNVGKLAEVLTKARLGEELTTSEQVALNSSKNSYLILTESDPQNVASGNLANQWANDMVNKLSPQGAKKTPVVVRPENEEAETVNAEDSEKSVEAVEIIAADKLAGNKINQEASEAMVKGYDGKVDAEGYAELYQAAYDAGASGKAQSSLSKLINLGLSQQTAFAAYDIGKNSVLKSDAEGGIINTESAEAKNEGGEGVHLRGSVQRNNGENTQGQLSGVEKDSGKTGGGRDSSRSPADEAAARLVHEGREVTVADLGIPGGSKYQKVYRLEGVEETAEMKKARKAAEKRGLVVRFFAGDNLRIETKDGTIEKVRGYIQGKYVYIRADHPYYTADQIMRHELGHDMVAKGEVSIKKVIERLTELVGEENVDAVLEHYAEAYSKTSLNEAEIWEEIVCDSLGDMNIFAGDKVISEFMAPVLKDIKQVVSETKGEANKTRGAPEGKASRDIAGKRKSKVPPSDEFATNAMIWAHSDRTEVGEQKLFYRKGKWVLLEKTDNGFVEMRTYTDKQRKIIAEEIKLYNEELQEQRNRERTEIKSVRESVVYFRSIGGNDTRDNINGMRGSPSNERVSGLYRPESNSDRSGSNESGEQNNGRFSRELDTEYLSAVNRGDMETAQRMVDEAAKKAGYKDTLYHGTKSFGFTEFDASRSDDKISFFVTSSEDIAQTYSGKYGSMKISDLESYDNMPLHDVVKKLREVSQESYEAKQLKSQYKIMSMTDVNSLIMEVNDGIVKLKNTVIEKIKDYAEILATDFNDSDYKTHEYLVKLKGLLDNHSYNEMSTPIYILLHRTEAFDRSAQIADLEYKIRLMNRLANKDTSNGVVVEKQLDGYGIALYTPEEAREALKEHLSSGNYKLYGNPGNQLVIKGEGQNWNKLKNWQKAVRKTIENTYIKKENGNYVLYDKATDKVIEGSEVPLNQYNEKLPLETMHSIMVSAENNRLAILTEGKNTTRDIAKFAKDNGYDSVKFEDIEDSGGRGEEALSGDVYAYFSSSNLKSADPVTYDDDGNVIPLSERFNPENKDIRYSRELDLIDYINEQGDERAEIEGAPLTNREVLANALESATQSQEELERLKEYKKNIKELNKKAYVLSKLKEDIKRLSFAKGQKDTAKIAQLKEKAGKIERSINYYDRQLTKLEAMKPIKDLVQRERQQAYKAAAEKGREALKRNVEGRHKSEARGKIKGLKEKFMSMLEHPTERQYVPSDLVSAMVKVCELVDTSTPLLKSDGSINKAQQARNEQMQRLINLAAEYKKIKNNPDAMIAEEYEAEIADYLDEIVANYASKNIADMTLDELNELYRTMKAIEETLRDARKLIGWTDAESVYDAGDSIINEQRDIAATRKQNGITRADDVVVNMSLSPMRAVLRMGGYNEDSALYRAMRDIERGVRAQKKFVMDAVKKFEALTTGKNADVYEKAIYDPYGKGLVDKNGKKFYVTKMQMMQAVMSYEREMANDKLHHVSNGGFTFADIDLLGKGEIREAVSAKNAHTVTLGAELALKFQMELANDQWAQDYMAEARKFFDETAKDAINEANMKLKHRIIATGKNYIPYEVNSDYIVREITSENDIQQVISGYGMLKDLKAGATQPIIITGLNNVLDRHIEQVGNVAALAVPIRNFNKIWNVKAADGSTTVKEAISNNWGTRGMDLITQAVKDVQGSRIRDRGDLYKIYKFIKSNIIGATFLGNVSVVLKQIGSMFTATSMIGWRNPVSMVSNLFETKANRDAIAAEVNKYTAVAWVRGQGLSDAELYELKTAKKKSKIGRAIDKLPNAVKATSWITQMDYDVALSLWKYAKEDVAKRTGLEGEELLQATAEYYNDVIENTQSMSDALHRPEIQKSDNIASETLGIFKTDLYQSAGLLRVAVENVKANPGKESNKALVKALGGTFMSMCWGSLITSLMAALRYKPDRYRDDEDDEITAESWLKVASGDMVEEMFGYAFPLFGSEAAGIISAFINGESYEFDNLTLDAVNDLLKAFTSVGATFNEEDFLSEKAGKAWKNLLIKAAAVFGVPANNVTRFIDAVRLHAQDIANGEFLSFEAGLTSKNPTRLYNAYIEGDADKIAKASRLYEDEKAVNEALRLQLRERDSRMQQIAQCELLGDTKRSIALEKEIVAEGHFDKDEVVGKAINAEINYVKGKLKDLKTAKDEGKTEDTEAIIKALIKRGYTQAFIDAYLKKIN